MGPIIFVGSCGLPHPRTWITLCWWFHFLSSSWSYFGMVIAVRPRTFHLAELQFDGEVRSNLRLTQGSLVPSQRGITMLPFWMPFQRIGSSKTIAEKKRCLSSQLAVVAQSVSLQVSSKTGLFLQRLQVHCLAQWFLRRQLSKDGPPKSRTIAIPTAMICYDMLWYAMM